MAKPKPSERAAPRSLLALMCDRADKGDESARALLFRIVAERVRSRFDADEAEIVSCWFDRMGAGEKPEHVLSLKKAGKPKGKTAARNPLTYGRIPDDYDVAHVVKQNIGLASMKEIYAGVAKALGMKSGTVRNIWTRLKKEIS